MHEWAWTTEHTCTHSCLLIMYGFFLFLFLFSFSPIMLLCLAYCLYFKLALFFSGPYFTDSQFQTKVMTPISLHMYLLNKGNFTVTPWDFTHQQQRCCFNLNTGITSFYFQILKSRRETPRRPAAVAGMTLGHAYLTSGWGGTWSILILKIKALLRSWA